MCAEYDEYVLQHIDQALLCKQTDTCDTGKVSMCLSFADNMVWVVLGMQGVCLLPSKPAR